MSDVMEFADREEFRQGFLTIACQMLAFGFYLEKREGRKQ